MGILIRQTATRLENSHPVFTHSFDSATGWHSSDNLTREIEWESQRLLVQPPETPIRGRQRNLLTRGTRRTRSPSPTQTLVAATLSTFVGLTAVTLMLGIRPALDKVTLRKDAAELVSLETQSRSEASPLAAQTPPFTYREQCCYRADRGAACRPFPARDAQVELDQLTRTKKNLQFERG